MLESVEMKLDKFCTITKWQQQVCYHSIQEFFCSANFYKQFISSFLCLAKPIAVMLKVGKNSHFLGPFLPTPAI
jgi:hypothetical protein